jgi:hypothetical protein
MKLRVPFNIALGITTELVYTIFIMLAAFFICLIIYFKI